MQLSFFLVCLPLGVAMAAFSDCYKSEEAKAQCAEQVVKSLSNFHAEFSLNDEGVKKLHVPFPEGITGFKGKGYVDVDWAKNAASLRGEVHVDFDKDLLGKLKGKLKGKEDFLSSAQKGGFNVMGGLMFDVDNGMVQVGFRELVGDETDIGMDFKSCTTFKTSKAILVTMIETFARMEGDQVKQIVGDGVKASVEDLVEDLVGKLEDISQCEKTAELDGGNVVYITGDFGENCDWKPGFPVVAIRDVDGFSPYGVGLVPPNGNQWNPVLKFDAWDNGEAQVTGLRCAAGGGEEEDARLLLLANHFTNHLFGKATAKFQPFTPFASHHDGKQVPQGLTYVAFGALVAFVSIFMTVVVMTHYEKRRVVQKTQLLA
jgi:hypothetical protein